MIYSCHHRIEYAPEKYLHAYISKPNVDTASSQIIIFSHGFITRPQGQVLNCNILR